MPLLILAAIVAICCAAGATFGLVVTGFVGPVWGHAVAAGFTGFAVMLCGVVLLTAVTDDSDRW